MHSKSNRGSLWFWKALDGLFKEKSEIIWKGHTPVYEPVCGSGYVEDWWGQLRSWSHRAVGQHSQNGHTSVSWHLPSVQEELRRVMWMTSYRKSNSRIKINRKALLLYCDDVNVYTHLSREQRLGSLKTSLRCIQFCLMTVRHSHRTYLVTLRRRKRMVKVTQHVRCPFGSMWLWYFLCDRGLRI